MYKEHLGVEILKVMRGTFTHRHYAKFSVYCYCGVCDLSAPKL